MQKWLRNLTLVASVVTIAFCAFLNLSSHGSSKLIEKTDCSAMCSSHGSQLPGSINVKNSEDNEKEPTPPSYSFNLEQFSLLSLYLAPITALVSIFYHQRKRLLSTQLRF